ncbi:MAG: hypothetical protein H7263_02400 [Candidatus Sericytochromatia bacterium]|nr:hypothetical protein [Candidatus Sericytochromatia bacterium]
MRPFLMTDGERNIMKLTFKPIVLEAFADSNSDYGKGAPSATSVSQEFDIGDIFRGTKDGVDTVIKEGINVSNFTLERNLESHVFSKFNVEFPDVVISSEFKNKIIYGSCLVVQVTRNSFTAKNMIKSFRLSGWHQEVPQGESTVYFRRVLSKHINTEVTEEEILHMEEKSPEVSVKFIEDGKKECIL